MMRFPSRAAAALAAFALALAGPAAAQKNPADEPHTRLANPPANMPSEAQIVGFLDEVDQSGIDASQMALERSKNDDVLDFANRMIAHHEENRRKTGELGISASRGELASKFKEKRKATASRLGRLEGPAFDRAYMAAMVDDHVAALDKLDRKAIPAAKTGALARHLQDTRPAVEEHLEEARRIKASLGAR